MKKISLNMSEVSQCHVTQCAYNRDQRCRAKAITIGDGTHPGCDTYFQHSTHSAEKSRMAGVGACKVSACQYNQDLQCNADSIAVDFTGQYVSCVTYQARQRAAA